MLIVMVPAVAWHWFTRSPDVAAVARSAPVQAARAEAARLVDERLAAVVAAAPAATPLGRSVEDRCRVDGAFVGGKRYV